MIHTYKGDSIYFELIYKNRKTISLQLDGYGNVKVHVPKGKDMTSVTHFLESNWDAIVQKREEMKARLEGPQAKVYETGERFLYLGRSFPIQISQKSAVSQDNAEWEGEILHIVVKSLEEERVQQALKRFYYQQCKALVEKSIRAYQSHFKDRPRSIRINDSSTNWGTCDAKKQLTFNWKLAMAPQEVIDYVVVHEMCHMVHLNHDRSFWRLVGKIYPDYETQERWLALSSWKMNI
jgi:predicted metal-dependent hydrolase